MRDSEILEKLRLLEEEIIKNRQNRERSPEQSMDAPPPKRRRGRCIIYSSSESEHEPENENNSVSNNDCAANETDIISVLGEDPTITIEFGDEIHATMAVRWNNILQKGIKKEHRSDLIQKYLPPSNCTFISPPTLNDEIKAAVQEPAVKRDAKLEQKQVQLGAAITCIGKAMDIALKIADKHTRDQILKHLGDGGQVLTDLHYLETLTRRSLLMQSLNKYTKEAIKDLPRDKLLFGEGLSEKLKAVKACSRSAADLKVKQTKPPISRQRNDIRASSSYYNAPEALNWRGTSRRPMASSAATAGAYRERRPAPAAPAATRRAQAGPRPPPKRS